MATLISNSPEETTALGASWGREAPPGWVMGLTGELGSGKTQLVKGLARGLGIAARVTSPSFALVNEYRGGRLPLFHLDLYRLDTPEQVSAAGLEDYLFAPPGVAVVEWIERWTLDWDALLKAQGQTPEALARAPGRPNAPGRYRRVLIETLDERSRSITYEDFGA
jgi:tRNA threonylcarbamoyladenosine biosynthesis protein TsaE